MSAKTLGIWFFAEGSTVGTLSTLVCIFTDICSFPSQCVQTDGTTVTSQGGTVVTESCAFCFCDYAYMYVWTSVFSLQRCFSVHLTVSYFIESPLENVKINKNQKDVQICVLWTQGWCFQECISRSNVIAFNLKEKLVKL